MQIAYIAGPYRAYKRDGGFDVNGILRNIMAAREVARKYWLLGYAVICPHTNTYMMDGDLPDDVWLNGDLEMISRVDVVVMMSNYRDSEGARAEHEFALLHRKEIIYEK